MKIRNTYGSNISFRADVLKKLNESESQLGLVVNQQIQCEETVLTAPMQAQFYQGVWYNLDAVVG